MTEIKHLQGEEDEQWTYNKIMMKRGAEIKLEQIKEGQFKKCLSP